jgi:aspartate/methionine/tyrosine aminotransferase
LNELVPSADVFAERLLREAHVAVTSGSAFGMDGFIRISYAAAMDELRRGVDRLSRFLDRLRAEAPQRTFSPDSVGADAP